MSTDRVHLVLDRIEGNVAVLIGDAGSTTEVHRGLLPDGAFEGAVLSVPRHGAGGYLWRQASVDEEATADRIKDVERIPGRYRLDRKLRGRGQLLTAGLFAVMRRNYAEPDASFSLREGARLDNWHNPWSTLGGSL